MEEPSNSTQSPDSQPEQMGMSKNWRPPTSNLTKDDETVPRRLEWIAVILFVVNFFMMMYSYSIYYNDEALRSVMVAVSTATAIMMLLSVLLSIFGRTSMSRIAIGVGIVGLMISVVSLGARLIP